MARKRMFTEEEAQEILQLYIKLGSLDKVAKVKEISIPTVAKYVREAGGTINRRGRPSKVGEGRTQLPLTGTNIEETAPEPPPLPETVEKEESEPRRAVFGEW